VLGRGIAMTYLSIVALIPLAAVVAKSLDLGLDNFWDAVTRSRRSPRCGSR
jgi:ABC-type sulfate transport system permease component